MLNEGWFNLETDFFHLFYNKHSLYVNFEWADMLFKQIF